VRNVLGAIMYFCRSLFNRHLSIVNRGL
jgi:hypothetical protein